MSAGDVICKLNKWQYSNKKAQLYISLTATYRAELSLLDVTYNTHVWHWFYCQINWQRLDELVAII